ncbi:hypothetical protein SCUP234_03729 [Seiridium cupressi]
MDPPPSFDFVESDRAKELERLRSHWTSEKDKIRRHYMSLLRAESDPDMWESLETEKQAKLTDLDKTLALQERDLQERHDRDKRLRAVLQQQLSDLKPVSSLDQNLPLTPKPEAGDEQPGLSNMPPYKPSAASAPPNKIQVEVWQQLTYGQHRLMLRIQGLSRDQAQKRRTSSDLSKKAKRPRSCHDVDQENGAAATVRLPDVDGRTTTYQEVRRRATEDGHWDTIIEYPSNSRHWYVLYCEEHRLHFKQSALSAAAKHLNSPSHNFPNRHQKAALEALGFRVVDCTKELQATHNAEVNLAFNHGYVPENIPKGLGKKVEYPFTTVSAVAKSQKKLDHESPPSSQDSADSPKKSREDIPGNKLNSTDRQIITNPKLFYAYYCDFAEEVDGEIQTSIWPVIILGWDDLTQGLPPADGLIPVKRLVDTTLLEKDSEPPKCYIYSDEMDKIVGWAPGYQDGGMAIKIKQRKFPVMFFDDHNSYAWVAGKSLSRFPIGKKHAPKKKGYKERAFNEARNYIAQREGYPCWEDREIARKKNQLIPWQPGMSRASRDSEVRNTAQKSEIQNPSTKRTYSEFQSLAEDESQPGSQDSVDQELQALIERGGEIPGDEDYQMSTKNDSSDDTDTDTDLGVAGGINVKELFKKGKAWSSAYKLRSEDRWEPATSTSPIRTQKSSIADIVSGTALDDHTLKDLGPGHRRAKQARTMKESSPVVINMDKGDQTRKQNASEPRAASMPIMAGQTPVQKLNTQRTAQAQHRLSMPPVIGVSALVPTASSVINTLPVESSQKHEHPLRREPGLPSSFESTTGALTGTKEAQDDPLAMANKQHELRSLPGSSKPTGDSPIASVSVPGSPDMLHRFELSLYQHQRAGILVDWTRPSPEEHGIQLFDCESNKVQSAPGGPVDVRIDAAFWGSLHLKSLPGNSVITIAQDDETTTIMFDRKKGDERISSGKVQARKFVDWLRNERGKLGLKLKTSVG